MYVEMTLIIQSDIFYLMSFPKNYQFIIETPERKEDGLPDVSSEEIAELTRIHK